MAIIMLMLVLLNIYPIIVSQNFIFRSKRETLQSRTALFSSTLSGLESMEPEAVTKIMGLLDDRGTSRVIVTDDSFRSIYDNRLEESSVGKTVLLQDIRRAMEGNDLFYAKYSGDSLECIAAAPVMIAGNVVGTVYIQDSDPEQAALLADIQRNLSSISLLVSGGVIVLSLILSNFLTRRIAELLAAIQRVREGEYGYRAEIRGKDEISQIVGEFNLLSDRLAKVESMRRRFVSDASHELKTPLASVKILADSIVQNEDMPSEVIRDFVEDIRQEVNRLTRLSEKLLHITKLDAGEKAEFYPVDLTQTVKRVAHMLEPLAAKDAVRIVLELSLDCYVDGTEEELYQIVFNLMENSVKYNVQGGKVSVFLYEREKEVYMIISDTGLGIPEEDLDRIYERFYRVDKARSREAGGSGLGLSIVKNAVSALRGSIKTESTVGVGTRVTIRFPASTLEGPV